MELYPSSKLQRAVYEDNQCFYVGYSREEEINTEKLAQSVWKVILSHKVLLSKFIFTDELRVSVRECKMEDMITVIPGSTSFTKAWTMVVEEMATCGLKMHVYIHRIRSDTRMHILMSPAIGDYLSCDVIAASAFAVYEGKQVLGSDFFEHAEDENEDDEDPVFFKAQVMDTRQETMEKHERIKMEHEIERLKTEQQSKEQQIRSLTNKIAELEVSLAQCEQNRLKMNDGVSRKFVYDEFESFDVSKDMVELIPSLVLGNVQKALLEQGIKCEIEFWDLVTLNDQNMTQYQLQGRTKRRLLALVEYSKNRVYEILQERAKLKYNMERQTLRLRRSIQTQRSLHKRTVQESERILFEIQQLNASVHPPLCFQMIQFASVLSFAPTQSREALNEDEYMFLDFEVSNEQQQRLLKFAKSCRIDADDEEMIVSVLLSMFLVLIRHITGAPQFVIGIVCDQRFRRVTNGVAVGPLTHVMPLRCEIMDLTSMFSDLVHVVHKDYNQVVDKSKLTSDITVYKQLNGDIYGPKITFEYINQKTIDFLQIHHVVPENLVSNPEILNNQTELDFRICNLNGLKGRWIIRGDIARSSVLKWMDKYMLMLEMSPKQISKMISRFYHSAFSTNSLSSVKDLRSSLSLIK